MRAGTHGNMVLSRETDKPMIDAVIGAAIGLVVAIPMFIAAGELHYRRKERERQRNLDMIREDLRKAGILKEWEL